MSVLVLLRGRVQGYQQLFVLQRSEQPSLKLQGMSLKALTSNKGAVHDLT